MGECRCWREIRERKLQRVKGKIRKVGCELEVEVCGWKKNKGTRFVISMMFVYLRNRNGSVAMMNVIDE